MPSRSKSLAIMSVGAVGVLVTMGALNGGTALTTSVWDGLKTYLNDMLTSTFTIMLTFIVLLVCVWQLAHGRGYGTIGTIIGLLAVALLGPGVVVTAATATRSPDAVVVHTAGTEPARSMTVVSHPGAPLVIASAR